MNQEDVVKALGNLSVMELIALTKKLEQEWGVKAEPQIVEGTSPPPVENTAPAKDEFDVVLASVPSDKKMAVIKAVREITSLGLKESKELVEAAPKVVKEAVSKNEADEVQRKLVEAGAVVEVK